MLTRIKIFFCFVSIGFWGCSSSPSTIVMLTDFGWDDPYAGAMQGAILKVNPDAKLFTITHSSPDYNIREASYILATAAKEYPENSIFLAVVDPGVGSTRRPVIIETLDGKYFVGPDNGIFTNAIKSFGLKRAIEITNMLWFRRGAISTTFHGRDIFGPAAAYISLGKNIEDAGAKVEKPVMFDRTPAELTRRGITGEIIHCDHYGNLVTNIPATLLAKAGWRSGIALELRYKKRMVPTKFVERYSAASKGDFILILNGYGLLEIACNMASAGEKLQILAGSPIEIRISEPKPIALR